MADRDLAGILAIVIGRWETQFQSSRSSVRGLRRRNFPWQARARIAIAIYTRFAPSLGSVIGTPSAQFCRNGVDDLRRLQGCRSCTVTATMRFAGGSNLAERRESWGYFGKVVYLKSKYAIIFTLKKIVLLFFIAYVKYAIFLLLPTYN